ncbi:hypothetical protein [Parafilimonas sp.]|uniref:hypothetical protein n=1 Tax=Parafilimonas sp. TaxID=1969739 RepID=UPI003F814806
MKRNLLTCLLLLAIQFMANAQTDIDGLMMAKNNFCVGPVYSHSSWKNYWEGTLKRDNDNIGTFNSNMFALMGNYGISDRLNVLFGVPYIKNKVTAGTLHKDAGIQDLSLWLKWMPVEKKLGSRSVFSVYTLGGFSTPLTNYQADYLPIAIGLHSTNFSGRLMVDYQNKDFFATASGTYQYRNNIHIDRTSYYTDEMHISNEVEMPDMASYNVRTGIRTFRIVAEAFFQQNYTLGGFDIRRNDMPFPSNRMNASIAGAHFKYILKKLPNLSLEAGGSYVLKGRNVGQAREFNVSAFYIFPLGHSRVSSSHSCKLCGIR